VRREADASRGVDGQADIPGIGQGGLTGVHAHPDQDDPLVGPHARPHRSLDGERSLDCGACLLEDCEKLVRTRVDLASTRCAYRGPEDPPDVGEESAVAITQARYKSGRVGDVSEEEGDHAGRQQTHLARAGADLASHSLVLYGQPFRCCALRTQLSGHEADGHDSVLFCRFEQPGPGTIPGGLVLKRGLVEARQRVADMCIVVDRQAPVAAGVDVGELAVGQAVPSLLAELGHGVAMIAKTRAL